MPPYQNATATTLTLLLHNRNAKEENAKAMAWEKAFAEYMQHYIKELKPDFIDVAFYSQRSIQDELERTSKSEISTIVISYLLMFLYLRLSLGTWTTSCQHALVNVKIFSIYTTSTSKLIFTLKFPDGQ